MDHDVMEFLKREERRLCEKYHVASIDEVLEFQLRQEENDAGA